MSGWWTYSAADLQMYSARTYLRLVEQLRTDTAPADVVLSALALAVAVGVWRGVVGWQAAVLGAGWLATAWLFFWQRYASIHVLGVEFAIAFAMQAMVLLAMTAAEHRPHTRARNRVASLLLLAGVLVPVAMMEVSRPGTQVEVFGLAPDATATVTLAWLVAMRSPARLLLAVVPTLWLLFSAMTLWTLAMPDWIGLMALLLANWAGLLWPAPRGRRLAPRERS